MQRDAERSEDAQPEERRCQWGATVLQRSLRQSRISHDACAVRTAHSAYMRGESRQKGWQYRLGVLYREDVWHPETTAPVDRGVCQIRRGNGVRRCPQTKVVFLREHSVRSCRLRWLGRMRRGGVREVAAHTSQAKPLFVRNRRCVIL